MNAPVLASDWPKARFTVAQIWALVEKGVIHEDARFELLDGEVKPMSPKGPLHEDVRRAVNDWLRVLPHALEWLAETTLYLDDKSFVEPDYVIFDRGLPIKELTPDKVLLAIEVSHESWRYDSTEKAALYAKHGVQEYWAIHAPSRMIRVHRGPSVGGWSDVRDVETGASIEAICAAGRSIAL